MADFLLYSLLTLIEYSFTKDIVHLVGRETISILVIDFHVTIKKTWVVDPIHVEGRFSNIYGFVVSKILRRSYK